MGARKVEMTSKGFIRILIKLQYKAERSVGKTLLHDFI